MGDVVGVLAAHHCKLNGFLCVGKEFGSAPPCGGWEDVDLAILRYPSAKSVVQLLIGNLPQPPSPHSHRQNGGLTKSRFPEAVFENRVVAS